MTRMSDDDRAFWRSWGMAFAMAAFSAVVTAGAEAIRDEVKARWEAQRKARQACEKGDAAR